MQQHAFGTHPLIIKTKYSRHMTRDMSDHWYEYLSTTSGLCAAPLLVRRRKLFRRSVPPICITIIGNLSWSARWRAAGRIRRMNKSASLSLSLPLSVCPSLQSRFISIGSRYCYSPTSIYRTNRNINKLSVILLTVLWRTYQGEARYYASLIHTPQTPRFLTTKQVCLSAVRRRASL